MPTIIIYSHYCITWNISYGKRCTKFPLVQEILFYLKIIQIQGYSKVFPNKILFDDFKFYSKSKRETVEQHSFIGTKKFSLCVNK